jgi:hypothetical protein
VSGVGVGFGVRVGVFGVGVGVGVWVSWVEEFVLGLLRPRMRQAERMRRSRVLY